MGKTFAEKVLAMKSDQEEVSVGEIINASSDMLLCSAASFAISIQQFKNLEVKKVWNPNKIVVVFDHFVPAPTMQVANNHKLVRDFVAEQGIKYFYDGEGVCHQLMLEKCHALPGMLVLGKDSHTISYGAIGAFSSGIGATEAAVVLATGKLWLKVPESVRIVVKGKLCEGVFAKDVILKILYDLTTDGCTYKAVEFSGETIQKMSISERFTLANMTMELGGKASFIACDSVTEAYLKAHDCIQNYEPVFPDQDALYEREYELDVSSLEPLVACPHQVDNVKPVVEVKGLEINQAFLGSCTNGRLDDLGIAATMLEGKKVHPNVRLLVAPASRDIYLEAMQRGYIRSLMQAGAILINPSCAACFGSNGILADGERCIASSNRNFRGRMGNPRSDVFLASPATVAASAICGKITDPRKFKKRA